jgi:hypothetical protein
LAEAVFDVPLALGTVAALEQEISQALAPAHAEVAEAVRAAAAKGADETGWKLAGKLCWLWTAVTATAALFVVHARRGASGLTALLGETGVVGPRVRQRLLGQLPPAVRAGHEAEGSVVRRVGVEPPDRVADPGALGIGEGGRVGVQRLGAAPGVGRAGVEAGRRQVG